MMITIGNDRLSIRISSRGAEMQAITAADGAEYLWDGREEFWAGRATNLFPYVGRLYEKAYLLDTKRYALGIHGFFRFADTMPREQSAQHVYLETGATEETLAQYPFPFRAGMDYRLEGRTLFITHRVHNTGESIMHFGLGGHPGFRVPLEEGLAFEDYVLRFAQDPVQHLTSPALLMTGSTRPFPLENGTLPLRHELFDEDAIILENPGRRVSLESDKGRRGLILRHPHMPYLGLWHKPQSAAPYVCLEPWLSLPGREGVVEDLATRPDLVHLDPGQVYENTWSIEIIG